MEFTQLHMYNVVILHAGSTAVILDTHKTPQIRTARKMLLEEIDKNTLPEITLWLSHPSEKNLTQREIFQNPRDPGSPSENGNGT